MTGKRLLSPADVARETGWTPKFIRGLVKTRAIASVKRSDGPKPRIWITREDLDAYIAKQRVPAASEGKAGRTLTGPGVETFL